MRFIRFAVPVLMASLVMPSVFAQKPTAVQFSDAVGSKEMSEIATAVRVISELKDVVVDPAERTLTLKGTADQIDLARWLFPLLTEPNTDSAANHEYQAPGGGDNMVHVYYLHAPASIQQFQEVATAVRTVADIRRLFTYNAPKAMIVRGTADQVALADWLVGELDQPKNGQTAAVHEYFMKSGYMFGMNDIRVFYLTHAATPRDFQEIASTVRRVGLIRQVFTYNEPRAMIVRSDPAGIALAEWLVNQLDVQATGQPRQESPMYGYVIHKSPYSSENQFVRVFFLNRIGSVDGLENAATQVKAQTQIATAMICNAPRALILRGSADQIELAEQLVKDVE